MSKIILGVFVFIIVMVIFVIYQRVISVVDYIDHPAENLKVTSDAFKDGGIIPIKYTGKDEDMSPSLHLSDIDPEARTITVIMDDLDHPLGAYNHWVIWNIPAGFDSIPEGIPREEVVSSLGNAIQGKSGYGGKHYYRGPNPPLGFSHEYIFKIYVLDTILDLEKDAGKEELQKVMDGHILQYGTLSGVFN